jgi:hypothetical protein
MKHNRPQRIFSAFITALFIIAGILAGLKIAKGQTNHTHDKNDLERFRLVRITAPAKVLNIERVEKGQKVEYISYDARETELGSFEMPFGTPGDEVKKGQWYFFSFCAADRYLYGAYTLTEKQLKGIPKK